MINGNITREMIIQYEHPRVKLVVDGDTIYEDKIGAGSFSYRSGSSGGDYTPGGCVTASCNFTVLNFDGESEHLKLRQEQEVKIYMGYGPTPETATYDLIATVYITDVQRSKNYISCAAYDGLRKGDKSKFIYHNMNLTVNEIITAAAASAGITVSQLPAVGGDIVVNFTGDGETTCRQAIMYALQLSGNFGFMTPDDRLICKWYDFNTSEPVIDYYGSDFYEATGYTGVQVGDVVVGSLPYLYVLSDNPFVTEDNKQAVANRLYAALAGIQVDAGNADIVADPRLQPGDCVIVPYIDGTGKTTNKLLPITSMTLKNSMKETIQCQAQTSDEITDQRTTQSQINDKVENGGSGGFSEEAYLKNPHIWHVQSPWGTEASDTAQTPIGRMKSYSVEALMYTQKNGRQGGQIPYYEYNPLMVIGSTAVAIDSSWTEITTGAYAGWSYKKVLLQELPSEFPIGTNSLDHGDTTRAVMPRAWGNVRVAGLDLAQVDMHDAMGIQCHMYVCDAYDDDSSTNKYGVWAYLAAPDISTKTGPLYIDWMVIGGNQIGE